MALYTKAIESGADEASLARIHSNRAACSMELHLYDEFCRECFIALDMALSTFMMRRG